MAQHIAYRVYGLSNKNFHGLAGNHHPEAEIISRVGAQLGWNVIRGSSTDGGKEAYDSMINILKTPGNIFAITPDGPQGPANALSSGGIQASQDKHSQRSARISTLMCFEVYHIPKPSRGCIWICIEHLYD